jgi:hypothetical protein
MYALKQMALQEKVYPKRFPIPVLQEVFFDYVQHKGRNSEGRLMLALAFKTNPFRFLSLARMGLRLWLAGRVSLAEDSIRDKEGLRKLLQAVDQAKEGAGR